MNKQSTLSAFNDELAKVRTKKKDFLSQMGRIIPWDKWKMLIQPYYCKGERGNKPCELELMLRLFILQSLYALSDEGTVAEVMDSRAFSEFCGVDSSNQVPDGDTLGRFRNLLMKQGLQEKLFAQMVALLMEHGLILEKGTIADSTLISAPSSAKNKEKQREPDAYQTKKGNTWHFGYTRIFGKKLPYEINRHPSQIRKLSKNGQHKAKKREHGKSSVCVKAEHFIARYCPMDMGFRIVEGGDSMRMEDIVRLLRMTYWAENRPVERIEKSVGNSACYGVCPEASDALIGFARVISDYATTYYLCDVVVDPAYRGRGLGKALVGYIESRPEYAGLRGFLITRDAHGLYSKFGYEVVNDRVMAKLNK